MVWWSLGFWALFGSLFLGKGVATRYRRLRLWRDALALYKVSDLKISSPWFWRARITFRSGPLTVRITGVTGSEDKVAVVIEGAEGFSILKLRRKGFNPWKEEILVGDEALEDKFLIEGPFRPVAALLDATLRGQLLRACTDGNSLEIGDGRLRAEVSEEELPRILSTLLNIGVKLAGPVDVERQIVQNARHDPEAGVRIFNLLLLARERPGEPETLEALRDACSDASPAVRLRAAIELGEEGRYVLQQIAQGSEDDASSARAVTYLRSELSLERLQEILSRALDQNLVQTARACLEALGRHGAAAVEAEPLLLQALQSEDGDLRVAAAQALGRVGSTAAVLPLQEAAEGSWLDRELRQAARQATAEIQARLEGASPGQLSLAAADAGRLSLAQAEAGQLSLEPEAAPAAQAEPLDVKSRLLHKARRDPKPEVRLFNLLALIRDYPGDPDTLKVLRGACIDPISKVRVRAAIELGEEGHDVLLRIVERSSDDAARSLAVSHLGSKLSVESVKSILSRALRKGSPQTARACLERLGRSGGAAAVDALAEVLALEQGELTPATALVLGATGSPAAEPPLLQALQSEDGNLRMAAAQALGRAGTAAAVPALQEVAGRFWLDRELRQAARQAIDEIQSRLEGAAPGQLSLAEAEAGQLSLSEAEAGQLSLAHDEIPLLPHATDEPEQPSRAARETQRVRPV